MVSNDVYCDSFWPVLTAEDLDEIDRLSVHESTNDFSRVLKNLDLHCYYNIFLATTTCACAPHLVD